MRLALGLLALGISAPLVGAQPLPEPLKSAIPAPGATGVARNTALVLRFGARFTCNIGQFALLAEGSSTPVQLSMSIETRNATLDAVLHPLSSLAPMTAYTLTVSIPGLQYRYSFTTGADLDAAGPRLLSISPHPGGEPGDPAGPYVFEFDEPLRSRGTVSVADGLGRPIDGMHAAWLSDDRRSVIVYPGFGSIPAVLQIALGSAWLRDMAGNPHTGSPISARWVLDSRSTGPPRLLGHFPDPGETDVPTNFVPQLLFDRAVTESSGGGVILEADGAAVPVQPSVDGPVVALRGASLRPRTTYTVRVTDQLTDRNGFAVDEPASFQFTTGAGPDRLNEATEVQPESNGPRVPTNTRMTVRAGRRLPSFAPLLVGSLTVTGDASYGSRQIAVSASLLEDRRTLVIAPREPLPPWSEAALDGRILDATGEVGTSGVYFKTSDAPDQEALRLVATDPLDGASGVPLSGCLRLRFDEPVSLGTPPDALRLVKDGERRPGRTIISGRTAEFWPARLLDPDSEYTLAIDGLADLAGNTLPRQSITFRTAAISVIPPDTPRVLSRIPAQGDLDPLQPLELRCSKPPGAANVSAAVTVVHAQPPEGPLVHPHEHPVRIEIEESTLRIVPLVPWPANHDLNLALTGTDPWSRAFYYHTTFRARSEDHGTRPEVVSVVPPPGTPVVYGQPVRLVFSRPMLAASEGNGGLAVRSGTSLLNAVTFWSEDRLSVTVLPDRRAWREWPDDPLVIVASAGLVDLAGNPLRAMTARFPFVPEMLDPAGALPEIVASWPARYSDVKLDPRAPITLAFSRTVDAASLNRSLWVMSSEGRQPGSWEVSAGGTLAVFRRPGLWPADAAVWLLLRDPVIAMRGECRYSTAAAPSADLRIVRSTLQSTLPANAVIEVEYNREPPAGRALLDLKAASIPGQYQAVAFEESQPRPRIRRLTPKAPLAAGNYVALVPAEGVLTGLSLLARVTEPVLAPSPALRYRAPLPGAAGVPLNARVALAFSVPMNELSAGEESVRVLARGKPLLCRFTLSGGSLTVTPLELLPPDETVEVTVAGLEDLFGRALEPLAWTFHTGAGIDLTAPRLLYSNAPPEPAAPGFDPQSPVTFECDEPLDPAAIAQSVEAGLSWSLSPDLRTVSVWREGGWPRGAGAAGRVAVSDWSGNTLANYSVSVVAGFEADREPLELRAVSIRDGQGGVPVNVIFGLLFNKPVASDALRTIRLMRGEEPVPLAALSSSNAAFRFAPRSALDPATGYRLIVEGVRDSSGNVQTRPQTIRFTTGEQFDVTPPEAQGLFTVSQLDVRFTEPIDMTSVLAQPGLLTWSEWRNGAGGTRAVPVTASWDEDRLRLTLRPKEIWRIGTEYTLNLREIFDLCGNRLSWLHHPPELRFQPSEQNDVSPVQVSIRPSDGAGGVPTNAIVQVAFSRTVATPPVRLYEEDALVLTLPERIAAAVPVAYALKPNLRYRIETEAFRDDFDHHVPAASSSFTTAAGEDRASLQLVSSSPGDGQAGVALETPWLLTFNKPLQPEVYLFPGIESGSATPVRYRMETAGGDLALRPLPGWPAATAVQLTIDPVAQGGVPALADWAGNRLASPVRIGFRTAAPQDSVPPELESVQPAAGATLPTHDALIELRFSEPVTIGRGAVQLFQDSRRIDSGDLDGVYGTDARTVTFKLFRLPANTRVTLAGTEGIRDLAGNPAAPFTLEFMTGAEEAVGPPRAELIEPHERRNVPADTAIVIRFDRVMDAASVIASLRVTADYGNVLGSVAVEEEGRAYRFRPDMPLAAGAAVRIYILPAAMDLGGWPYPPSTSPFDSFFVAGPAGAPALARLGFGSSAPADAVLELAFDRDLDPASVNQSSVWLRRGSRLVPGSVSLRGTRVVQFTPSSALEPGAEYTLTAGAALRAAGGSVFAGRDLRFRAVRAEAPPEIESVRVDQWKGRAAVRVRFDRPLSPLAYRAFRAERLGRRVAADVLASADHREVWLVPHDGMDGELRVVMEGAPARNGRILPTRRLAAAAR